MKPLLLPCAAALLLSACASEPRYSCGVPLSAGGCRTVSKVFEDSVKMTAPPASQAEMLTAPALPVALETPPAGNPLLTRPRVVRVLILPWEDEAGDLNAGGYLYLRLDRGSWTLTR